MINSVLNTTEMLVVLVTVFFGVTFTLMNPRPILGALFSVVPERHHARTLAIMVRIAKFVPRWSGAVMNSMLTIGPLFFLLMWPIFGFADALMLGLIACLLSAIPLMGPMLTLIPALLLAIDEGGMTPMWVVLAYVAVQALEGNVILPLVMSRGMKLHPLAVIFSMHFSVAAFGVLGVLIAAPLVAIVGIVHEELYRKQFLPTVTDEDLDRLARSTLLEKRPSWVDEISAGNGRGSAYLISWSAQSGYTPWCLSAGCVIFPVMNIIILLIVLLVLFGGGGFYFGGPMFGGGALGLILLIAIVLYFTGGLRR